jgi:hypothetical protein
VPVMARTLSDGVTGGPGGGQVVRTDDNRRGMTEALVKVRVRMLGHSGFRPGWPVGVQGGSCE